MMEETIRRSLPEAEGSLMPIHDWTRVDSALFHDFHQGWVISLRNALNAGALPADYYALVEQSIKGPIPDVLALHLSNGAKDFYEPGTGGLAVSTVPPRTRLVQRHEESIYARKADQVTVRHRHGRIVAVIEIVSPGNKASNAEFRAFLKKASELIRQGVHLLVIDLFPPTKRDPQGIHHAIWNELTGGDFDPPPDKPLTLTAYDAGPPEVAYVEPIAVGDDLPDMPLFLEPEHYVNAPLEATYQTTWEVFPGALKGLLEVG